MCVASVPHACVSFIYKMSTRGGVSCFARELTVSRRAAVGDKAAVKYATIGPRPIGAAARPEIDPVDRFQRSRRGSAGASEHVRMAVYPAKYIPRSCHGLTLQLRPPTANLDLTIQSGANSRHATLCDFRFPSIGNAD